MVLWLTFQLFCSSNNLLINPIPIGLQNDLFSALWIFDLIQPRGLLTQLTTGGSREADMATPISGPAEPWSKATATPVPDVNAHKTPIQRARTLPLQIEEGGGNY